MIHVSRSSKQVLPQIVPFDFGADQINLDEMISATCTVNKGDLPIDIAWIHVDINGHEKPLSSNDGIVITRTNPRISTMSIDAVGARHVGNFTCVAKNRGGGTHHSTILHINGEQIRIAYFCVLRHFLTSFAICSRTIVKFLPSLNRR